MNLMPLFTLFHTQIREVTALGHESQANNASIVEHCNLSLPGNGFTQ